MDTSNLFTKFTRIGARLKVADRPSNRRRVGSGVISLDVQEDRDGEYFEIARSAAVGLEVAVLDVQPADRHLLLLVREGGEKQKFLCGHDERHWFVAAIPESAPVGTVLQAKEALKPSAVRVAEDREGLRAEARNRRKNAAYRRQGEWFFLPVEGMQVDEKLVLRDEPLSRGNGGKPHWVDFCYPDRRRNRVRLPAPPRRRERKTNITRSSLPIRMRSRGAGGACGATWVSMSADGCATPTIGRSFSAAGTPSS